jgi:rod shape determining protein RodA
MRIIGHLKKLDWPLALSVISLSLIGLVFIHSSSGGDFLNFKKQVVFLSLGIFLMVLVSFFDYRILRENPYLILFIYLLCVLALIGLFFFAPEIRGTRSWYKLGPVSIDPVEFAKIALIIILAKYFSMRHVEMYRFWHIVFSGFYVFIPAFLVFLQPNLGSALILLAIWISILFISGINLKHFLVLAVIFLILFSFSWFFFLEGYQKDRILSFAFPEENFLEGSWNQAQSEIAIGSGGFWGKGIGEGTQAENKFLPEPQTDFIFAVVAEETGLLGVFILMSIYGFLIIRLVKLSISFSSNFPRLLFVGFASLLASQMIINVGMNLGLLPVIGLPLPFVSYGGSGLISMFLALGILQGAKVHG